MGCELDRGGGGGHAGELVAGGGVLGALPWRDPHHPGPFAPLLEEGRDREGQEAATAQAAEADEVVAPALHQNRLVHGPSRCHPDETGHVEADRAEGQVDARRSRIDAGRAELQAGSHVDR